MKTLVESILSGRKEAIERDVRFTANMALCEDIVKYLKDFDFQILEIRPYDGGHDKGLSVFTFRHDNEKKRDRKIIKDIIDFCKIHKVMYTYSGSGTNSYISVATHTEDYQKYNVNYPAITISYVKRGNKYEETVSIKAPNEIKDKI